jgi:energy-coupling factor transporter transmembrane protein EcfT
LFILLIANITAILTPPLHFEFLLMLLILGFGFLCGAYQFSIKMVAVYLALLTLQLLSTTYLPGMLQVMIGSFFMFIRKFFPCAMLGSILISTTRANEFMAAMNRIHIPKKVVIPLTVMLRYFPMVKEDWRHINDAMKMRDVSPSFGGLLIHPSRTIECLYVPLMMSASKIADELSAAAVTRGIENPKPRTCLQQISFRWIDAICMLFFVGLLCLSFLI